MKSNLITPKKDNTKLVSGFRKTTEKLQKHNYGDRPGTGAPGHLFIHHYTNLEGGQTSHLPHDRYFSPTRTLGLANLLMFESHLKSRKLEWLKMSMCIQSSRRRLNHISCTILKYKDQSKPHSGTAAFFCAHKSKQCPIQLSSIGLATRPFKQVQLKNIRIMDQRLKYRDEG
jgi:hypothetical protein